MDDMEQVREENVAGVNAECKWKDCDPPLQLEGHHMLGSPVVSESGRSAWTGCPPHVCVDALESNSFNNYESSLGATEPQCSMNDTTVIVEELAKRNYGIPNVAVVSSPDSRGKMHSKQGQWQHLYQLGGGSRSKSQHGGFASRDKDPMMASIRGDLKRTPSDLKLLSRKRDKQDPEEISSHFTDGYNKIMPSNTLRFGDTRSKVLPTSCFFPQFSMKKNLKGKGVACNNKEPCAGFGLAAICQNHKTCAYIAGLALSANKNQFSSHDIDKLGPESLHDGISLRDCLKPGCRRLNKIEAIHLFKKIVELVDFSHSQGVVLQGLRPSCFILLPSNRVKYTGPASQRELLDVLYHKKNGKIPLERDLLANEKLDVHLQNFSEDTKSLRHQFPSTSTCGLRGGAVNEGNIDVPSLQDSSNTEHNARNSPRCLTTSIAMQRQPTSLNVELEKKWYTTPVELNEKACTFSANIYGLGVLLFELLCCFKSWELHSAAMLDLHRRILPPNILSENPIEAGFCLWLLHPDCSSRPTAREILQSELLCGSQELYTREELSPSDAEEDADSELLLHFLTLEKEQKEKDAFKLVKDLECLEADIKEVQRRNSLKTSLDSSWKQEFPNARDKGFDLEVPSSSGVLSKSSTKSNMNEAKLMRSISQLEHAYFSMRSQIQHTSVNVEARSDKDLLKNRERWSQAEDEDAKPCITQKPVDRVGAFFEGVCKFVCYSKLEECGTLRTGDLLNSSNVICSLSFDSDDDYIAAAGVSKKIKIFEFSALLNESVDIHYPVVEMSNKSKLSCVCWNKYIKNNLASTDYDGVVQIWDASTGQGFYQYTEHSKRAWSVDFSQVNPTMFASGSDDCSVKLWSINEKKSTSTIQNPANVCCVQFSAYSSHLLAFGSADYKTYCYDLRHTRIPWCTLAGHGKAVSYVRFLDAETLVSASTDNTMKLWDLNKTSPAGLSSSACSLTFSGHINVKNFVGLSVFDGYIACGSESNEVFTYYKSLPMPISSYKFGTVDPISGVELVDDNAQFVSSVCWRQKSNMVIAANSTGNIKLLRMARKKLKSRSYAFGITGSIANPENGLD